MNEATASDATILSEWSAESTQAPSTGTNYLIKVHPRAEIDGLIELGGDRFVIGRDTQCDLRLEGASISRQHAAVELVVRHEQIPHAYGGPHGIQESGI